MRNAIADLASPPMTSRALSRPKEATTDLDAIRANQAHNFACEAGTRTIKALITCGEILFLKKQSLAHGRWLPWVRQHLDFSEKTAQNYLRVYQHRDEILQAQAQSLLGALTIISDTKRMTPGLLSADEKILRRNLVSPLRVVRKRLHQLPRDPLFYETLNKILTEVADEVRNLEADLGI